MDRRRTCAGALMALALWGVPRGAGAAETLAALQKAALERSPAIAAIDRRVTASRARASYAAALPDPTLGLAYVNDGWSPTLGEMPMSRVEVMLAQPLPYPGKRARRAEAAGAALSRLEAERARAALDLSAEVARAWLELVEAQRRRDIGREQLALWRDATDATQRAFESGQGALQDTLRAEIETTRLAGFLAEAQAAETRALSHLDALLARPPGTTSAVDDRLELPTLPEGADALARATRQLPELRALAAERAGRRADLLLAELAARPDLELEAGYAYRGGLPPMWQLGMRVGLPVWRESKLRPATREREATLAATDLDEQALRLRLRRVTTSRLALLASAHRLSTLYATRVLPLDRDGVAAALASYRSARVPFVTVLDAIGQVFRDRLALLDALVRARRLHIALEAIALDDDDSARPRAMDAGGAAPDAPAGGM